MSDLEQRIDEVGMSRHTDHYAGVERVGDRVVVHRKPSRALEESIRATAGDAKIEFRDADHSRAELESLRQRVERDLERLRGRGVELTSLGAAEDGSAVVIGTRDVALATRELAAFYGPDAPFRFEQVGPVLF